MLQTPATPNLSNLRQVVIRRLTYYAGVFLFGLLVQRLVWVVHPVPDLDWWARQVHEFWRISTPSGSTFVDTVRMYPGTTILWGATALTIFGLTPLASVVWAVSGLIAGATALAVALCRYLRPGYWWIGVMATMLLSHIYADAGVVTALGAALAVPLALAAWILVEFRPKSWAFVWLGGSLSGVLLATRFDAALIIVPLCVVALAPILRITRTVGFLGITLGVFWLLDPFLWFSPLNQMHDLLFKIMMVQGANTGVDPTWFLPTAVVALLLTAISFVLGALTPRQIGGNPRFMLVVGCITLVFLLPYLVASSPSVRFLGPAVLVWESFLPLFLLTALSHSEPKTPTSTTRLYVTPAAILVGWVIVQGFLLAMASGYFVPPYHGTIL